MATLKQGILKLIREAHAKGRPHPSSKRFYGKLSERGVSDDDDVDQALSEMVKDGIIRVASGLWYEVGVLEDTRKPKGPPKLDPKSAAARTLPLEFFKP